jgi:hypothetical protein
MDSIDRMCAVRAQPFACVKQPETMPCKVATSCRVRAATDRANQAQKMRTPSNVPLADDHANITSTAFTSSTILIATRATTLRISSKSLRSERDRMPPLDRRAFLKVASLAAVGSNVALLAEPFSLQASQAETTSSPNNNIQVALIGAGIQGRHDTSIAI